MKNTTLSDVKNESLELINKIKNNQIKGSEAKEIVGALNTIIEVSKIQIDFLKSLSQEQKQSLDINHILEMFGAKKEPTIEDTLKEIQERRSKPYEPSK
jgi:hypothetical protein